MTDEIKYWQSEDYWPTWEDFIKEWKAGNAEYLSDWFYDIDDILEEHEDEWDYPQNPFVKAVNEGRLDFAAELTDFIEEGEDFYNMILDYCSGSLQAMTLIVDNSRWYKSDAIAEIYEGLRNRETLRKQAEEAETQAQTLEERVEELEEELNRLRFILDENGIDY